LYKLNDIFLDFECWGNTKKSKSDNIDMVKNRNKLQNPLYIGDTNGDMTAANKAHVKFYQLTYGFGDKIDEAISFPTFTDLVKNLIPN
jgi:phosphoglycolate phosphatase